MISSKLPFSTSKIGDLKKIFHAGNDSPMEKMIDDALLECERSPSTGETKKCVSSIEDMIDFSTSVLGQNVVLRTTEEYKRVKGRYFNWIDEKNQRWESNEIGILSSEFVSVFGLLLSFGSKGSGL